MAHLLVIDDEGPFRYVLRLALEQAGHEVTEAADGKEGVRAFRLCRADLVVCDLVMPGQEGLQTIHELRQLDPAVKVIAITGGDPDLPEMDFLPAARLLGASAVLAKPFDLAVLTSAIRNLLGG
jgi:CheY-like chemotaxis protein